MAIKTEQIAGVSDENKPEESAEGHLDEVAIGDESLEEAIANLSPEQAEMFMRVLSLTMKKRRLMLLGTLLALFLLVAGTLVAFVTFHNREPGQFALWVFLVPFALAGATLWGFGRMAKRAGVQSQQSLAAPLSTPSEPAKNTP